MATMRTRRLGNLIQAELGELLLKKVKDPRLHLISITQVDVAPDLSHAKVYYSLLDAGRQNEANIGFISAASFLRRELARNLNLKSIPRLLPVYDPSLLKGAAMDDLIRKTIEEDQAVAALRDNKDGKNQPEPDGSA